MMLLSEDQVTVDYAKRMIREQELASDIELSCIGLPTYQQAELRSL